VSDRRPGSRVRAVGFDDLTDDDIAAWQGLRRTHPGFESPFFDPRFSEAVHGVGGRVTVVIGADAGGAPELVWPVQRDGSTLRHVGWPAADFQGPVTAASFDPAAVLAATGARTLAFDHLVADVPVLPGSVAVWRPSPYLDVAGGLEGYLGRASKSGRSNMGQARRKTGKAVERYGEMTFTPVLDSADVLDEVIALKRGQYAESGARDYFADPSRVALMHALAHRQDTDFAGVLSEVRFGETLVAAHFGLRSADRLHWWFPVYAADAADLSPGWILLRELTSAAPGLGIVRIDLGRGSDEYKRRAMTGQVMVGEGLVSGSALVRARDGVRRRVRARVAASGLAPRVRKLARRRRS
jgi:CelD/BcsL family acetyltransferase involved in cellulose biosynthesis